VECNKERGSKMSFFLTYATYALSQSEHVLRQKLMSEVIFRRLKFKLKEVITFIIN